MKIVTPTQMAAIDRHTIEGKKIPGLLLMEHAGIKVVEAIKRELPDYLSHKFLVVAGTGNNAGDGFVIARLLARAGAVVGVELVRGDEKIQGDARTNLDALAAYDIDVFHTRTGHPLRSLLQNTTVVIDAMLGTGAKGELTSDYREAVENIVEAQRKVVAVDVPTGLDASTGQTSGPAIRADFTVTMGLPKLGFFQYPAPDYIGALYIADIGFPPSLAEDPALTLELTMAHELASMLPPRRADSHKGDYGRVLVVGGSRGMVGAAVMAARTALRAGAGLVRLVVPDSQQIAAASLAPEIMVSGAEESGGVFSAGAAGALREMASWSDLVLMGPGLGRGPELRKLVCDVVESAGKPVILDADALHALVPRKRFVEGDILLTPHAGELSHLMDVTKHEIRVRRTDLALETAKLLRAGVVLKGPYSLVATVDGRLAVNPTGNPGMATAGSGDILAGLIAGLRARPGAGSHESLKLAVYLHGLAGDLAYEKHGRTTLVATDLLEELPRAMALVRQARGPIAYDKVRLI